MYLQKRHDTWWAFHDVPVPMQAKLTRRLRKSLGTGNKAKADRLASLLWLHDWSHKLDGTAATRDNDAEAAFYRDLVRSAATDDEREALKDHIANIARDRAEAVPYRGSAADDPDAPNDGSEPQYDPAALASSVYFLKAATGQLTPLDEHLDEWLAAIPDIQKTKDMKKATILRLTKRFPYAQELTAKVMQQWLGGLTIPGGKPATKTVQRMMSEIRGYWKHLKSKGVVTGNPFADLTLPTSARKVASYKPFAPAEVVALLAAAKAADDDKLVQLMTLAMWSGGRIEELCSLQIPEVDMKRGAFKVKDAKTDAGVREVPIHAKLRPTLKALIGDRTTGYVLEGLSTNKYDDRSDAIGKRFGHLKTKMKFSKAHVFHSIRKTVVTLLENAGVLENLAADIVGHEKPRITYGLYSGGATLEVKREALAKLKY